MFGRGRKASHDDRPTPTCSTVKNADRRARWRVRRIAPRPRDHPERQELPVSLGIVLFVILTALALSLGLVWLPTAGEEGRRDRSGG
jgi:hypothetical protein